MEDISILLNAKNKENLLPHFFPKATFFILKLQHGEFLQVDGLRNVINLRLCVSEKIK